MYEDDDKGGLHFTKDITLGQMIQIASVFVLVIAWFIAGSNKTDRAIDATNDLKQNVTAQISDLKQNVADQLSSLRSSLDNSNSSLTQALTGMDARLRNIESATASNTARIDNIERASSIPFTSTARKR